MNEYVIRFSVRRRIEHVCVMTAVPGAGGDRSRAEIFRGAMGAVD